MIMLYENEILFEQAIYLKFPNIKELRCDIVNDKGVISFKDNGEYTKEEVEGYLFELKKECSKPITF